MVVTSYLEYQTIGGETVLVAVDDVPGPLTERASLADAAKAVVKTAGMGFDAALGTVTAVARSFTRQFANNEDRPREMELSFSLEATGELGVFAVGKSGGKTSFTVKLKWVSEPPTPSLPGPRLDR